MRKFLTWFFILIFLFLVVWTLIKGIVRIDKGQRCVVWTKFSGTKEKIYYPGLYFFPLRAIPPFFKLSAYPITEEPVSKLMTINLPYNKIIIHTGDYRIKYRIDFKYKIKNKTLVRLTQFNNYIKFKNEIRESLIESEKAFILNKVVINSIINNRTEFKKEEFFKQIKEFSLKFIKNKYKDRIEVISLNYKAIYIPDIKEYRKQYAIASRIANEQSAEYVKKLIALNYEKHYRASMEQTEIDKLKEYLKLLKKHGKKVLPFLFLQKLAGKVKVIIVPQTKNGIDFTKLMKFFEKPQRQNNSRGSAIFR